MGVAQEDRLAAYLDPRVRKHQQFEDADRAFREWDRRARVEFWTSLSGRTFERELARLFQREGYDVELTPGSGDEGVDIVLKRFGRTTVVQCKQTQVAVGPAVARELYGAMVAAKADEGILASVGGATRSVHDFFGGKPLRVMDLSEIIALHRRHG
jgi:restriction system protein